MKPRIKACAYLRMSTDDQETSIPIQRKRLLELADREGYEIIEWFTDEGKSGSRETEKRIEWLKMLASAPTAEWKAVLCYNMSRFSRLDVLKGAFAKETLRDNEIILHTYVEGLMDWNSAAGLMIDSIHTTLNNEYAANLGKDTLEGKLDRFLTDGSYGYKCPYGYNRRIVDPDENVHIISRKTEFRRPKGWTQTLVPGDPEEVEAVKWLFETFATQDVGLRWLARQLNVKGIPSPRGLKWCAERVHKTLLSPFYVGDTRLGRYGCGEHARLDGDKVVKKRFGKKRTKKEGLLKSNTHEGLVSRDLWNRVQKKLKENAMLVRHLPRGEGGYALKSILICGHCGLPLYGLRNQGDKKSRHVAYVCKNAVKYGSESGCAQWKIRETDILPVIIGKLAEEIDIRVLEKDSVKPPRSEQKSPKDPAAALVRKRADLERKIDSGSERFLTARVELTQELEAKLVEWKAERARLDKEIERIRRQTESPATQLEEWKKWFEAVRTQLVHVQTNPHADVKFEEGLKFTPQVFRQALRNYGCRVIVWWKKRTARRWEVDRVRLLLGIGQGPAGPSAAPPDRSNPDEPDGGVPAKPRPKYPRGDGEGRENQGTDGAEASAPSVTSRSLIVWCGARNGRVASSGSSGLSRPMAL